MSSHAATQSNLADGLSAGKVIAVIGAGIGVAAGPFFSRDGAALMVGRTLR